MNDSELGDSARAIRDLPCGKKIFQAARCRCNIIAAMITRNPTMLFLDAPPCGISFHGTDGADSPNRIGEETKLPEVDVLRREGFQVRALIASQLDPAECEKAVAECEILLTWSKDISKEFLERAARCLLVQIYGPGNGPAHVDLEAARRLGIFVASLPDYASDFWAARTLDALRGGAARIDWRPRNLKTKRLGMVGLGQVGRRVARGAQDLGLRVFAFDPFCPEEHFAFNSVLPCQDLNELIGSSHILSLHIPLISSTHSLLNAENLRFLPAGSLLLNFSAPEVVNLSMLKESFRHQQPALALFAGKIAVEHPQLESALLFDPWHAETSLCCRSRIGGLLVDFLRGGRPPHLLIDPACPRQALLRASTAITASG